MGEKFKITRLENNKRLMTIRVCGVIAVGIIVSTLYQWTQTPPIPKNK